MPRVPCPFLRVERRCFCLAREDQGVVLLLDALFRFEHEAAAFVEVDPFGRVGAVEVIEADVAFEDVGVLAVVLHGRIGPRDFDDVAQFGEEELVVGPLCPA